MTALVLAVVLAANGPAAANGQPKPQASGYQSGAKPACGVALRQEPSDPDWSAALAREDKLFNHPGIIRYYYPGLPKPWHGSDPESARRSAILSFKENPKKILSGADDSTLATWFVSLPHDQDIYWSYYHEPEDNIAAGSFSAADYRSAWKHLLGLAGRTGNPRLHATLILMGYDLAGGSHRNWHDYYPGPGTVQVLAWDTYNGVKQGTKGYRDPKTMFAASAQIDREQGLRFAVAETGSMLSPGDKGTQRAAWLRSVTSYLTQQHAVFVSYFDIDMHDKYGHEDFRLRDQNSVAAYRAFCS